MALAAPAPQRPMRRAAPTTAAATPTIYDVYPLTLHAYLTEGAPPLDRAFARQRLSSSDADSSRRLRELLDSSHHGATPRESATYQRQRSERRSSGLVGSSGKFQGEVYETTERSRVLSALKRRSRANKSANGGGVGAHAHANGRDAGASTKFTAQDVLRAGVLTKQGSWRRNWKSRFFILRKDFPSLCYYKSEEKLELLGSISITSDTLVLNKSANGGQHAPYRLQVRTDDATLLLEAESRDNHQRWMDACQELVDTVRAAKFVRPTGAGAATTTTTTTTTTARGKRLPANANANANKSNQDTNNDNGDSNVNGKLDVRTPRTPRTPGTPKTPGRIAGRRRRGERGGGGGKTSRLEEEAADLDQLLTANFPSSDEEEEDDDDDDVDNQKEEEEEEDTEEEERWLAVSADGDHPNQSSSPSVRPSPSRSPTKPSPSLSPTDPKTKPKTQTQTQTQMLTPSLKRVPTPGRFDLVLELLVGRQSKLMRSEAATSDKVACAVQVTGYSSRSRRAIDLGTTDGATLARVASASAGMGSSSPSSSSSTTAGASANANAVRLTFLVVLTASLVDVDQLRFALLKSSTGGGAGGGGSSVSIAVGRCVVTSALQHAQPVVIPLTERSSSFQHRRDDTNANDKGMSALAGSTSPRLLGELGRGAGGGSSSALSTMPSDTVQLVVRALPSLAPQAVLPTTGVDMANAKYLLPTTLSPSSGSANDGENDDDDEDEDLDPMVRTTLAMVDNGSFLTTTSSDAGGHTNSGGGGGGGASNGTPERRIAVDEILRVPRSTFALPLAYLDYLEASALQRTRELLQETERDGHGEDPLQTLEMAHRRRQVEEYIRQRVFLTREEARLLRERGHHAAQEYAAAQLRAANGNPVKAKKARKLFRKSTKDGGQSTSSQDGGAGSEDEADARVAPFKRSTYKSLAMWQYVPTNMQDQFLCVPSLSASSSSSRLVAWHTMTMGCPAAHSKGFANGGYASVSTQEPGGGGAGGGGGGGGGLLRRQGSQRRGVNPASSDEDSSGNAFTSSSDSEQQQQQQGQGQARQSYSRTSASTTAGRMVSPRGLATVGGGDPSASQSPLAALKARLARQERLEIISSQILSAAVACVLASLDLALQGSAPHCLQLERAPVLGFLVHFESLLSTQGKEIGMLEDFAAAAQWLRTCVFVQFRKHPVTGEHFAVKRYTPPHKQQQSNANTNVSTSAATSRGGTMMGRRLAGGTGLDGAYTPSSTLLPSSASSAPPGITGTSSLSSDWPCILVTIGVSEAHCRVLPVPLLAGKPCRVRCVLFTQGVNEKQSLAHALKQSAVKVQDRINRANLVELRAVYARFRRFYGHGPMDGEDGGTSEEEDGGEDGQRRRREEERHRLAQSVGLTKRTAGGGGGRGGGRAGRRHSSDAHELGTAPLGRTSGTQGHAQAHADLHASVGASGLSVAALDDLLVQIEHRVCSSTSPFKKNVALLMDTSDFCRELGGARVTCCKSGKDRTAMSVTLEQARRCCATLAVPHGRRLCAGMRRHGVRRPNVFLNTASTKFAFNEVQRRMLPECYKPPAGTYKSGKT